MKKNLIVGAAAVAVIALFASFGAAVNRGDGGPGRGRGPGGPGGPGGPPIGMIVSHMATELGLTDAQKASIDQIVADDRTADQAAHEADRAIMDQLKVQGIDGTFNEPAVRALASQLAASHTERIVAREQTKAKVFAVLTAEQRTKLIEKLEKGGPGGPGGRHDRKAPGE